MVVGGGMTEAEKRAYWKRFEGRLRDLPVTDRSETARQALVSSARFMTPTPASFMTPEAHAESAHRLRFVLGPTVDEATRAEVAVTLEAEQVVLLAAGVSPRLLGIEAGGVDG